MSRKIGNHEICVGLCFVSKPKFFAPIQFYRLCVPNGEISRNWKFVGCADEIWNLEVL